MNKFRCLISFYAVKHLCKMPYESFLIPNYIFDFAYALTNICQEFLYIYSNRKSVCLRRYLFCVFYRIMYRYVRQPSESVSFYGINIGNSF